MRLLLPHPCTLPTGQPLVTRLAMRKEGAQHRHPPTIHGQQPEQRGRKVLVPRHEPALVAAAVLRRARHCCARGRHGRQQLRGAQRVQVVHLCVCGWGGGGD